MAWRLSGAKQTERLHPKHARHAEECHDSQAQDHTCQQPVEPGGTGRWLRKDGQPGERVEDPSHEESHAERERGEPEGNTALHQLKDRGRYRPTWQERDEGTPFLRVSVRRPL
jgi:hypothetical protein